MLKKIDKKITLRGNFMKIFTKQALSALFLTSLLATAPLYCTPANKKEDIQTSWYKKPAAKYALIATGAIGITLLFFLKEYYAHLEALRQSSYKATVVSPRIEQLWDNYCAQRPEFKSEEESLNAYLKMVNDVWNIPSLPRLTMQEFFMELKSLDISNFFEKMKKAIGLTSA